MNEEEQKELMKDNQRAVKHGAEGALRRKKEGKPFIGLAEETERAITIELETIGISDIVKRDAIRMQTVSDLYYAAVLKAAQDGDLAALDRYTARYGWMQSATLRAWAQVAAVDKERGGVSTATVIESIRRAKDEKAKR